MDFCAKRIINKSTEFQRMTTYICEGENALIEINSIFQIDGDLVLQTHWNMYEDSKTLIETYNKAIKKIEFFPQISYQIFVGRQGVDGGIEYRTIPFEKLHKTINPLPLTDENDSDLEINSNYGAIIFGKNPDFYTEGIKTGAKHITIISPFHLGSLVSKLAVTTQRIKPNQSKDMEQILERTYNQYLYNKTQKMSILK